MKLQEGKFLVRSEGNVMKRTNVSGWLVPFLLFFGLGLQVQAQTWSFTGSMAQARNYFTATLLKNGGVLVVGGSYRGTFVQYGLTSAELYNASTGTFSFTGGLNTGRYSHTATLLNSGQVLIAGGIDNTTRLSSAELYDPSTGKFTFTGSMHAVRGTAGTLLNNGMVLFAGGYDGTNFLSTAELYDPSSGTFITTGNLNNARAGHSATLLSNGKVLIAGGDNSSGAFTSAELYDPSTGTFSVTGSLHTARAGQTATLLGTGQVLIAAGQGNGSNGGYLGSAELYNPATGKFTVTGSLNTPRYLDTAHLLSSGKVLIVAGNHFGSIASAELYDPSTGSFKNTASLNTPRQGHASALLSNGQVLAVGGYESQLGNHQGYLASAELYH
jgi:WD40 repeat protein